LIIQKKIKRVVAAVLDPNPKAAHGGKRLSENKVQFESGLMEQEAKELNIGFFSRMTRGRPWVRMKIAATLDGRTALADGRSQWITGPEARKDGHRWRARACAILTGIGTVKADDPRLTVRDVDTPRQPLRVVVDSRLEIPEKARILEGGGVLVFTGAGSSRNVRAEIIALPNKNQKVDLPTMLEELAKRGVNELHVEAGFRLNGSLVAEGCVDEYLIYLNPSFLGDEAQGIVALTGISSLDMKKKLTVRSIERIGEDIRILARS
jgi:diaminohydroxyphosphoribosylaminopyrimidine deaminase/5-amino-6-(5-phosphoribosylamino)uracil reductase